MALSQVDSQREALRQRSVADIISSYDMESNIAARGAAADLTREQTLQRQRLAPFDVADRESEIEYRQMLTRQAGTGADLQRVRTDIEKRLAPMRVDELRAEIKLRESQRVLNSAQADRLDRMAGLDSNLAKAQLADVISQTRMRDFRSAPVRVRDPLSGQDVDLPRDQVDAYLGRQTTLAATMAERRIDNKRQADALQLQMQKDNNSRRAALAETESKIKLNDNQPAAVTPLVDLFNEQSDAFYVYIHFPDAWGGGEWQNTNKQVPIPPTKEGRQPTAREIAEKARDAGMTVKDYLEKYYIPRNTGGKAPWQ